MHDTMVIYPTEKRIVRGFLLKTKITPKDKA